MSDRGAGWSLKCSATVCLRLMTLRFLSELTGVADLRAVAPSSGAALTDLRARMASACDRPGGTELILSEPMATALRGSVFGKFPWTRPSWLPNTLYHGMPRPVDANGRIAAARRPGTSGNPKSVW